MEVRPPATRAAAVAHNRAWQTAYEGLLPSGTLARFDPDPDADTVDGWASRLLDDGDYALVAETDGGTDVGYAVFRVAETKPFAGPGTAELKEIYVDPDHWSTGAGTELLAAGIDVLPSRVDRLRLAVFADNDRGRGFYEARGFEAVGGDAVEIDGQKYRTAIYERAL